MTENNSININGGNFQDNAIGIGVVKQRTILLSGPVADLRTALADSAAELVARGRDEGEQAEIRDEIKEIEKELNAPEPDGGAVKTRWKSVLSLLGDAAAVGEQIARITDLVAGLFGR